MPLDGGKSQNLRGASVEVMTHHIELHNQRCESDGIREHVCACGTTIMVVCASCDDVVFMAIQPGTFCEHAAEMQAESEAKRRG